MTDRPILFNAPMIRAILREIDAPCTGKTQTRRLLQLAGRQPDYIGPRGSTADPTCWGWENSDGGFVLADRDPEDSRATTWHDFEASYRPGDRLWVRESCATWEGHLIKTAEYRADITAQEWADISHDAAQGALWKLRPSIHMPRWASRITLTVTDVRVQRLQDISAADAIAEGIRPTANSITIDCDTPDPRDDFRNLWDGLNAARGYGWGANPWVAAITFQPHLRNIDQMGAAALKEPRK